MADMEKLPGWEYEQLPGWEYEPYGSAKSSLCDGRLAVRMWREFHVNFDEAAGTLRLGLWNPDSSDAMFFASLDVAGEDMTVRITADVLPGGEPNLPDTLETLARILRQRQVAHG